MFETIFLALVALAPADPSPAPSWPGSMLKLMSSPSYQAGERLVDNWRLESAINLDLSPLQAVSLAAGHDLAQTPRCVKLNNYWCIKRAGWNGEIAADFEGHVAFASALEGAAVATQLLRRYYVEYGRHSARAIVSHWAPAQCALVSGAPWLAGPATRSQGGRAEKAKAKAGPRVNAARMLPQRVVSMGLAPGGIENTLRARWLAAHRRVGVIRKPTAAARRPGRSRLAAAEIVSDLMRAPTIAQGMGELARKPMMQRKSMMDLRDAPGKPAAAVRAFAGADTPEPPVFPPRSVFNCSSEYARIASYATRVAQGVAAGPDDDLKLFSADGSPTEKLPLVMANMAAVEIGPLRASKALISLAISQLQTLSQSEAPHKPE
jgi:hypothetical protein